MKTNPFTFWERRRPRRQSVHFEIEGTSPAGMPALPGSQARGARTPSLSLLIALLAASTLLTHAAFAAKPPPPPPPSSGTLVLDFLYPGGTYAVNNGLAVAPSGTIYASGIADDGSTCRVFVLGSSDSGSSWSLLDDFAPPGRQPMQMGGGAVIASDADGNLYVAVVTMDNDLGEPDQWYVRRSTDGGATWTTVDEFLLSGGYPSGTEDISGIAVDAAGDVYVAGESYDTSGYPLWTIRKGVGGTSFSTVDLMPQSYTAALFAHPTAGIFAVGKRSIVIKSKSSTAWTVRRSTDGGATWSNVDTFQLSSGNSSWASGIDADANGNLYVVGKGTTTSRGSYVHHWIVRKSTDGGISWSTVDDFQPSGSAVEARRFASCNGDLYVAGIMKSSAGTHWIVRRNPGGTGAWSTIDDYQYGSSSYTAPNAMAADVSGNLFVGGTGSDHWLIKKY